MTNGNRAARWVAALAALVINVAFASGLVGLARHYETQALQPTPASVVAAQAGAGRCRPDQTG